MSNFQIGDIVKGYRLQGTKGLIGVITELNPHVRFNYKVEWLNPRVGDSRWGQTYGYFGAVNLRKVE
jgi:hypothetical protein